LALMSRVSYAFIERPARAFIRGRLAVPPQAAPVTAPDS
jgi:hypothetical protein